MATNTIKVHPVHLISTEYIQNVQPLKQSYLYIQICLFICNYYIGFTLLFGQPMADGH